MFQTRFPRLGRIYNVVGDHLLGKKFAEKAEPLAKAVQVFAENPEYNKVEDVQLGLMIQGTVVMILCLFLL